MAKKATTSTKRAKKPVVAETKVTSAKRPVASAATGTRPTWWASFTQRVPASRTPVGALVAEFVGTFMLAGVILAASGQPIIILFALAAIVLSVGALSGAHLNPALSAAAWVTRQISAVRLVGYVVAQVLGAMLAFVVLNWLLKGSVDQASASLTGQATELFKVASLTQGKEWYAFWSEVLGAAVLGFGVASIFLGRKAEYAAAYTYAGTLFVALILGGKTALLNPAVAVAVGAFDTSKAILWPLAVWVLGAVIGASLGMALYRLVQKDVSDVVITR